MQGNKSSDEFIDQETREKLEKFKKDLELQVQKKEQLEKEKQKKDDWRSFMEQEFSKVGT
jgi:hypothetical protein